VSKGQLLFDVAVAIKNVGPIAPPSPSAGLETWRNQALLEVHCNVHLMIFSEQELIRTPALQTQRWTPTRARKSRTTTSPRALKVQT
jgi:hypothetical protein